MKLEAYGEFIPRKETVEVTVYWINKEGVKMRSDLEFPWDFFVDDESKVHTELTFDFGPNSSPRVNFKDRV